MGCHMSSTVVVEPNKELCDYLTDEEISLVRNSWEMVAQDMTGFGMSIFKRLLSSEKELKALFKKMLIRLGNGDEMLDEQKLQSHALIVMQGLGAAVESLEDSVYLSNVLITMGKRHASYNAKPYMFQHLWLAVEHALRERLDRDLDIKTHQAWKRVFDYIASKMTEGIMAVNPYNRVT